MSHQHTPVSPSDGNVYCLACGKLLHTKQKGETQQMQNEHLPQWINEPERITVQTYELGNHTASFDENGRMAITGPSGSILLSSQEAWNLLDTLYSQREGLYHKIHSES